MWDNPPTEMVDFLGRRRLCGELPEPEHRDAGYRQEAQRLRCASLPEEERGWRARYAGNAAVLRWLDLEPERFRLNNVVISAWDGPPAARPRRIEQSGVDARTGEPYRLVIVTDGNHGRTRITASFAGIPQRSFTLDDHQIPLLDLQSLRVALGTPPVRRPRLYLMLRYGEARGYCFLEDEDDRPELQIVFDGDGVRGYRTEGSNCETATTQLPDAAAR